ncbi:MAG: hypothetical protein QM725_00425 [Lacibacter sp.]
MKLKIIFILLLLCTSMAASSQSNAMYRSVKIDTSKVISKTELVKISERIYKQFYSQIFDAKEKSFADQQFAKLENAKENKLSFAQGLSSTAVVMAGVGSSKNTSVIFSAKAAATFPGDTLIVNNFGAILRMLDSVKTSLPVLLYAKSLYPNAPVILTNLANTLFELYDDRSAEYFYNRALKINPNYSLASQGLVSVYLKRKDLRKAMEQLFKSVQGMYSETMKTVHERVKYQPNYRQPDISNFNQPGSPGAEQPEPNKNVPIEQLHLPPFPNWSEQAALIADNSIEKIIKKLGQIASSDQSLNNAMKILNMSNEQKAAWYENEKRPGRVLYRKGEFAMSLMEEYFEDQLNKADREFLKADSLNILKFDQDIQQATSKDEAVIKQSVNNPEALQQYMVERCNKLTNLIADYFNQWKTLSRIRHNKYNDLLTTYWVYCEQYLNNTYDLNDFQLLNGKRKSFVAMHFSLLYTEYSFRKLGFAFSNIASFASAMGDCPKMPPPPPPKEKGEDELNVPDKNAPDCPFKGKKAKIGLIVCSFGIECESVEIECGEGIIAGTKWNFKNKELSVFVGAGVKADFGVEGAVNATAEAKAGFEFTFNKDGQPTDVGYKTEVGAKGSVGNTELGEVMEVKITAQTGLDISRTTELTYNPLGY